MNFPPDLFFRIISLSYILEAHGGEASPLGLQTFHFNLVFSFMLHPISRCAWYLSVQIFVCQHLWPINLLFFCLVGKGQFFFWVRFGDGWKGGTFELKWSVYRLSMNPTIFNCRASLPPEVTSVSNFRTSVREFFVSYWNCLPCSCADSSFSFWGLLNWLPFSSFQNFVDVSQLLFPSCTLSTYKFIPQRILLLLFW